MSILFSQNMLLADDNIHLDSAIQRCSERFCSWQVPETSKILRKGIAPRARSAASRTIGSLNVQGKAGDVQANTFEG
jgi:hypothetical protein